MFAQACGLLTPYLLAETQVPRTTEQACIAIVLHIYRPLSQILCHTCTQPQAIESILGLLFQCLCCMCAETIMKVAAQNVVADTAYTFCGI